MGQGNTTHRTRKKQFSVHLCQPTGETSGTGGMGTGRTGTAQKDRGRNRTVQQKSGKRVNFVYKAFLKSQVSNYTNRPTNVRQKRFWCEIGGCMK